MDNAKYTNPKLREKLKEQIQRGGKGGRPGQWSARKSQMLASAYKKQGGGYTNNDNKSGKQKSLDKWTAEQWTTQDGSKATNKRQTKRYLPKKAWDALSPSERKATETKKRAGAKAGTQFVGNTGAAKTARKKVSKKTAKKASKKTASAVGGRRKKKATAKKTTTRKKTSTRNKTTSRKKAPVRKKATGHKKATGRKKAAGRKKATGRAKAASRSVGQKFSGRSRSK